MKHFVLILIVSIWVTTSAQDWAGFETGNYGGVHSLQLQPALIAGGPYLADLNIISVGATLYGNSLLPNYNVWDNLRGRIVIDLFQLLKVRSNDLSIHGNVMFPSFLYSVNDRIGVGLSTQVRATTINRTSELAMKNLFRGKLEESSRDQVYSNQFLRSHVLAYTSIGVTYGHLLLDKGPHELRFGATFKLLEGMASASVEFGDVDFEITNDSILTYLKLDAAYRYDEKVDGILGGGGVHPFGNPGVGGDLGFSYTFNGRGMDSTAYSEYRFRIGVAVSDIGAISFTSANELNFSLSSDDVNLNSFGNIKSFEALDDSLKSIFNVSETGDDGNRYWVRTPIGMFLQFDYHIGKHFYAYLEAGVRFNDFGFNAVEIDNSVNIRFVPRFEDHAFGVYLPLEYSTRQPFKFGLSLRWKAFVIGSDSIFSRWFYKEKDAVGHVYLAIKAPLLKQDHKGKKR